MSKTRRSVLMIAFHFPPAYGFSGTQRTLKFVRFLKDFGWQPIVLTAAPYAYPETSSSQLQDIPASTPVIRAPALDASRHLAIAGKYFRFTALPDRWASWRLFAVKKGLKAIHTHQPDLIWSTYPLATSLQIAAELQKKSQRPWVADFRDAMMIENYPTDQTLRQHYQRIESQTVHQAEKIVVTTPGMAKNYQQRYPAIDQKHWRVITNGFDEEDFTLFDHTKPPPLQSRPIQLLHSGRFYPGEETRDPRPFLHALSQLKNHGLLSPQMVQIQFRATGMDHPLNALIKKHSLEKIVHLKPLIPYQQAIEELFTMDGLLLFQGQCFHHLIPAKLFEYLRVKRPLFALTHPKSDSGQLLLSAGITTLAPLHQPKIIAEKFYTFLQSIQNNQAITPNPKIAQNFSRRATAQQLAQLFDQTIKNRT
ncbi:glycosyltransferase [Magnetococcales bacterium HHB-1]